jgi:glycosyltransferase involved in cell wall biosynthesis
MAVAADEGDAQALGVDMPVSVVLCTHNPRPDYLRRALESLKRQTLDRRDWEFLMVDNASGEDLARGWDLSWHPGARHVREDELGLTAARLRGIAESRGDLLVFVDDDNVLAEDFLQHVAGIPARYPHVGVIGAGTLTPEFEIPAPPELTPRLGMLALRTVDTPLWSNDANGSDLIPWGAGMGVTRPVATAYRELLRDPTVRRVVGRRGKRLFCGEDDLFSWAAAEMGFGFGLFPELRVTHLISGGRLNRAYFLKLVHDQAYSHRVLSHLLGRRKDKTGARTRLARMLVRGLTGGFVAMRFERAGFRGQDAAEAFIAEQKLEPLRRPS